MNKIVHCYHKGSPLLNYSLGMWSTAVQTLGITAL